MQRLAAFLYRWRILLSATLLTPALSPIDEPLHIFRFDSSGRAG